jgi:2,5-diketo-D-gluconate reductase A
MAGIPDLDLNSGATIPQLGFGTWQIPPDEAEAAVAEALRLGYRSIDTAAAYGNEREVGAAIAGSGIPRDEVFVTTKLWNTDHGTNEARAALEGSLGRLGLDRVDLYLIHWPVPSNDRYVETWQAMEGLRDEGLVTSIGVSNFNVEHLDRLADETGTVPAVNQVEVHPYLQQEALRRANADRGILTEDWSPLAEGQPFDEGVVKDAAEAHSKSPAQVILRWHLQLGSIVIPKSVTPERIAENIEVFDFALSGEEMNAIAELDRGERTGPDPATFVAP